MDLTVAEWKVMKPNDVEASESTFPIILEVILLEVCTIEGMKISTLVVYSYRYLGSANCYIMEQSSKGKGAQKSDVCGSVCLLDTFTRYTWPNWEIYQ